MIGDPIPSQRQQVIDQLSTSIDQFFASGGQAEQLDGPTFGPKPIRPIADDALADDAPAPVLKPGSRAEIDLIRKLAKTMSFSEAVVESGITRARLIQLSKGHLIRFQVSSSERRARDATRQLRETETAKRCQQIRALAGTGITRNQAAQQIGISYGQLVRLISAYDVDLPAKGGSK